MIKRAWLGLGLVLGLLTIAGPVPAMAASQPTGLTLSPVFQQIRIEPTASQQTATFSITNNQNRSLQLSLSATDFNNLLDTGGQLFVGSSASQWQQQYGLAKWLSLADTNLTLLPKQTVSETVTIDNRSDLSAGGHYGAVLIHVVGDSSSASVPVNSIGVNPVATELLFVTKVGGDTYKLALDQVEASHNIFKLPSSVTLKFSNHGNSQVTPRGFVTITKAGGQLISKGIINENSDLVLPGASRYFPLSLQSVGTPSLPGSYKLMVNFRLDGYNQYRGYQSSLWFIPPIVIITVLIILGIVGSWLYAKRQQSRAKR